MAIYSFNAKIISRKAGQSAIATAAYNARDKLMDERTGEIKHYYAVDGSLLHSGIYTPENAPEWAQDREQLWNRAEAAENRKDSQIARNFIVALPHELTDEQRRYAIQDFVKENFTRKGYAADLNIHAPDKDGDNRNYHAHILVTDRKLETDGFAKSKSERQQTKTQQKEELEKLRESWEKIGNRHLERWGFEPTLDRRTLEAQGIERAATIHKGADVCAMERKGIETDRGDLARQIEARNLEIENLKIEAEKISQEIINELQKQQREKAGTSTETLDPTLYDRGGMVSQQRDANTHHQARQNALDEQQEKNAEPDRQAAVDNSPYFAYMRAREAARNSPDPFTEQEKQWEQNQQSANDNKRDNLSEESDSRNRDFEDNKRQQESAENYKNLTEGGESSSASSKAQTPDEIQAEKMERARARLERLSEEQGGGDEPERERGEKVRERTRER